MELEEWVYKKLGRRRSKFKREKSKTEKDKVEFQNYKKGHFKKEGKAHKKSSGDGQNKSHFANIFIYETQGDSLILSLDNIESWIVDQVPLFMLAPIKRYLKTRLKMI